MFILQVQPPTLCLLFWGTKLWSHLLLLPFHSVAAAKLAAFMKTWKRYIYKVIKNISLKKSSKLWFSILLFPFQTPGPAAYKVVDPCIYRQKPPQYSMTGRNFVPGETTKKPGPGAHYPERVRNPIMYYLIITNDLAFCSPTDIFLLYRWPSQGQKLHASHLVCVTQSTSHPSLQMCLNNVTYHLLF